MGVCTRVCSTVTHVLLADTTEDKLFVAVSGRQLTIRIVGIHTRQLCNPRIFVKGPTDFYKYSRLALAQNLSSLFFIYVPSKTKDISTTFPGDAQFVLDDSVKCAKNKFQNMY